MGNGKATMGGGDAIENLHLRRKKHYIQLFVKSNLVRPICRFSVSQTMSGGQIIVNYYFIATVPLSNVLRHIFSCSLSGGGVQEETT